MKNSSFGKKLIVMGAVLILAASLLFGYNMWQQYRAQKLSAEIMDELARLMGAGSYSDMLIDGIPDYLKTPDMEMPTKEIDGVYYVGYLNIPSLDLELPICDDINEANLLLAPCRDSGTAYKKNLVIGAHNYNKHFGRIGRIPYGEEVIFTDLDGNKFSYKVVDIEILQPNQYEELCSAEKPLTLFTCTWGGRERIVVRCE